MPITTSFLAYWQVKRLKWKTELIANREKMMELDPAPLPKQTNEDMEYMHVKVSGVFSHQKEQLLEPRMLEGEVGAFVITPIVLEDGRTVLVNRGWIPRDLKDPLRRKDFQVPGNVEVEGFLRVKKYKQGLFAPHNKDPKSNIWYWQDIVGMSNRTYALPIIIESKKITPETKYPREITTHVHISNNHLQYIITWSSLTIFFSAMYYKLIFGRKRI